MSLTWSPLGVKALGMNNFLKMRMDEVALALHPSVPDTSSLKSALLFNTTVSGVSVEVELSRLVGDQV